MELKSKFIHFIKVNLSLFLTKQHSMKTYCGSGGIASRILEVGTRCRLVSFTIRPLYPQVKSPQYTLDRRLGEPQDRAGHGVEEKNSQPPPGIGPRSSNRPARSQSLYRPSYPSSIHFVKSRIN
jgi:hypothetical protein